MRLQHSLAHDGSRTSISVEGNPVSKLGSERQEEKITGTEGPGPTCTCTQDETNGKGTSMGTDCSDKEQFLKKACSFAGRWDGKDADMRTDWAMRHHNDDDGSGQEGLPAGKAGTGLPLGDGAQLR